MGALSIYRGGVPGAVPVRGGVFARRVAAVLRIAVAAPAAAGSSAKEGKKGGEESFGDYPEALDEEDDDLPF